MFDFHEKRKIRAIVYSRMFLIGVIVLGLLIARSAYERYTAEREMAEKRDAKMEELAELNGRAQSLTEEISRLKNERGIEEELRGRFDAVRSGEEVVIILEDSAMAASVQEAADTPPPAPTEPEPWWSFLRVLNF